MFEAEKQQAGQQPLEKIKLSVSVVRKQRRNRMIDTGLQGVEFVACKLRCTGTDDQQGPHQDPDW